MKTPEQMAEAYGPLVEHLWSRLRLRLVEAMAMPLPKAEIAQSMLPHLGSLHPGYEWVVERLYERALHHS